MVTLLSRALRVNRSRRSLKKNDRAKSNRSDSLLGIKRDENYQKYTKNTFLSKSLVFWERLARITSESQTSIFFKEIKSDSHTVAFFVMSDLIESLTITLLFRGMRVICSHTLFFKERRGWIAHSPSIIRAILSKRAKSERANSQPWGSFALLWSVLLPVHC